VSSYALLDQPALCPAGYIPRGMISISFILTQHGLAYPGMSHHATTSNPHLVAQSDKVIDSKGPSKALPQQHLVAPDVSRQAPVTVHVCTTAAGHNTGWLRYAVRLQRQEWLRYALTHSL
jgi:hypothetical protein